MKLRNLKIKNCPECRDGHGFAHKTPDGIGITCYQCGHSIFGDNPVELKRQWNAESKRRKILFRKF